MYPKKIISEHTRSVRIPKDGKYIDCVFTITEHVRGGEIIEDWSYSFEYNGKWYHDCDYFDPAVMEKHVRRFIKKL